MDSCCSGKKSEELALLRGKQATVLKIVMGINFTMFFIEFGSGFFSRSTALMADSLDMLGDAIVYGFSLYVLHKSEKLRAIAALIKGILILVFGLTVLGEATHKLFHDIVPAAQTMGVIGVLALGANSICLFLLHKHRNDDINLRSTWICSRNDIISNVGVLVAAILVDFTETKWPDIIFGFVIALLFLRSAWPILTESIRAIKTAKPAHDHG